MWINATLEEQKEINNSRRLCFLFMTTALNDLLNFSINLTDDHSKQITFEDKNNNNNNKKSILSFKNDVFFKWIGS